MKVTAIMATCGRHHLAERSLRFFIDQKHDPDKDHYDIYELLIYNNSDIPIELSSTILEGEEGYKRVKLVNQHISKRTGKPYENLGDIYNDALEHLDYPDVIVHWDDDDIFLPNHIMEGLRGLNRGKFGKMVAGACKAYKPAQSYYRHPGGVMLTSNTLEPSIFVKASHIRKYGYSETTTDQHLQWVNPLVQEKKIFVDPNGVPTLVYNWGDTDIGTFKTSGDAKNPNNFNNYRKFSRDHGDRVLIPWPEEKVQKYYDLVYVKH